MSAAPSSLPCAAPSAMAPGHSTVCSVLGLSASRMTRSSVAGEVGVAETGVPILRSDLLRLRERGEGETVAARRGVEDPLVTPPAERGTLRGEGKTTWLGVLTRLSGIGDTRPLPPASSPPPSLEAGSLRPPRARGRDSGSASSAVGRGSCLAEVAPDVLASPPPPPPPIASPPAPPIASSCCCRSRRLHVEYL